MAEKLCTQEISAPGWSGLTCDHPESMHDPVTGKCSGVHEFGWGDHECDCEGYVHVPPKPIRYRKSDIVSATH